MDRRTFLSSVATAVCTGSQQPGTGNQTPAEYRAEAARLTAAMQRRFWDADVRQYRAPVRSAETVDSDAKHNNGYVVWPAIYAFHALAAGERQGGHYGPDLSAAFAGLEAYYDQKASAYNAWLTYPGNNDKYYDDNAWAIVALIDAFEATRESAYRDRAAEIMARFMPTGWDSGAAPGGMRWGTDPTKANTSDHNACSNSGTALAAFRLAKVGIRRDEYIRWGRSALEWVVTRMRDADDLIRDGLRPPDWRVIGTKWTYNTGAPIHAFVEHYRLTKDTASLKEARRLGRAAIDRSKRLYDGLVHDPDHRYWYDNSFFVPYLADGLIQLWRETGDRTFLDEVRRNADYAYTYIRDPADDLYFRNWRLWKIGEAQLAQWEKLTGQTWRLEADGSERASDRDSAKLPVAQRPFAKTLLANAGMARMFWLLAGT